jgi:molybdenum cofactor cytidylyltransferase
MTPAEENTAAHNIAIIVLAAGGSRRLGRPKQLLVFKDKSLLQHILDTAKNVPAHPVIAVLGANSHLISNEIAGDKSVHSIINDNWMEGISSSIRSGLNALLQIAPLCDGVILIVCDQPFLTASLLNNLIAVQNETGKLIVASSYENTAGTPVFFHKTLFPDLLALQGDAGAKKVIMQHPGSVATVPFPRGHIDIDTTADYEALKKNRL